MNNPLKCFSELRDPRVKRNREHLLEEILLMAIAAERYHKATGKSETETRYYITGLQPHAARLNRAIRQHCGIENKLHWVRSM